MVIIMSLGIVNDDLFEAEINRLNNPSTTALVKGRAPGGRGDAIPDPVKKVIAECALLGDKQEDIAKVFGVTQESVNSYSQGFNTSSLEQRKANPSLVSHITEVREKITKKATNRLQLALNSITPDKVKDLSANKAGQLAKDMAAIVREMEPPMEGGNQNNGVQIIFQAPREKRLNEFEFIQSPNE